jgi:heptosyltransferase-2
MKRILVIRGGAIGDFIFTLPVFEALKMRDPDAEVDILGYSGIAELAVGRRHAANLRRVDGAEWAALFSPRSARLGEAGLGELERRYLAGFDETYCVWPDGDGVIGENLLRAGSRKVVSVDPTPVEGKGVHVVDHIARQCERAGLAIQYREPRLYPSERDRRWVERYLRVSSAGDRPLLALSPGSGSASKNWPADHYAAVARHWVKRCGCALIVSGPAEEKMAGELRRSLEEDGVFFLSNEPLPCVAATLERCEAFIGNDSGITHMAAAVRTPTLAIFGRTNPDVWQPRAPRVKVLQPAPPGADLATLMPAEVLREVEALLRPPTLLRPPEQRSCEERE